MPTLTAADHQNILNVVQHSLNGDTSVLIPSGQAFYLQDTGESVPLVLKYDGFVTKRGTLSEAAGFLVSPNTTQTLVLDSREQAAQFRAGDTCYLVGNAYAGGAPGAVANTVDGPLTVSSVNGQNVTVTGRNNAGGPPATSTYAVGSSLVVVDAGQPGGYAGGTSDGPAIGNQALGELLAALEAACNSTAVLAAGGPGHSTTRICVDNPAAPNDWDEEGAMLGATVTFLTGTAANIGCTAKVASTTVADPAVLFLEDIKDADGNSIAVLPATPNDADTVSIELDLSDGKLTDLREAGGDMTTAISAMLTMHRKLDEAFDAPEIPLVQEWQVWGQKTGTLIRSIEPFIHASSTSITVDMDGAVGDIPFPLSGTVRVINADDGVDSAAWGSADTASAYVAYTRQKRSNVLTFTAGVGALGADYGTGSLVELQGTVNGFAKNSGFAPQPDNKHLVGLLYQLVNAVNAYNILGS